MFRAALLQLQVRLAEGQEGEQTLTVKPFPVQKQTQLQNSQHHGEPATGA